LSSSKNVLKRLPPSFLCLVAALAFLRIADAEELIVEADVAPSVSVNSYASRVNIGTVTTGDFSGTFTFSIQANTPLISLQVLATNLYKDSDPSISDITPIKVNQAAGVDIHATAATSIDGSGGNAAFGSSDTLNKPNGIFTGYKTEAVKLESTQQGVFDQDVDLRVTWTQDESIKPAGTYGGYIVLYVSLVN
jgi:hypothetical protein